MAIHWIEHWEQQRSSGRGRLAELLACGELGLRSREALPWGTGLDHRHFTSKLINRQQVLNSSSLSARACQLWAEIFHIKTGNRWRSTPPKWATCNSGCSKVAHHSTLSNEFTLRSKRKLISTFKIWNCQNIDTIPQCSTHEDRAKKHKLPRRATKGLELRKYLLRLKRKKEFQMPF